METRRVVSPSTPTIASFDPSIIPYQLELIKDIRTKYDYSLGTHHVLLSGSIGSSKSTVMAHIIVTHCLLNLGARFLIGRLSMPALRATLFNKILEHIGDDLKEGEDYWVNQTTATIKFRNGSEVISRSWSDKKYFKMRSLELSGAAIEEIIENDTEDFYNEIKMRVGRLPHIKENIIISATNPGDPSSWQYKTFVENDQPTTHVYYSLTEHNPFLPKSYIENLKQNLDPKLARRMLYGEWISIATEVVYYAYDTNVQYRKEKEYAIDYDLPIWISWDFNIGEGKPMSVVMGQMAGDTIHIFGELVIEGMRTLDSCEEIEESGILTKSSKIILTGDASGKHRDTRSKTSDYDIIKKYFHNIDIDGKPLDFETRIGTSNPPVRLRHNTVNSYCKNANGQVRLYIYKGCKVADEGMRLTSLKKNAGYIEDDSKHYQHITTAIGYMVCKMSKAPKKNVSYKL